ncbi:MAG: glutamate-5-semialdehyde dehydrogenase [Firmicutes bacterium]|nr:glutamate-5-semialdehyde dehydrogenase [Bacillota bacterium]
MPLDVQLRQAKEAQRQLGNTTTTQRNAVLEAMVALIEEHEDSILAANQDDLQAAAQHGVEGPRLARLGLTREKLSSLVEGLRTVIQLADPLGRGQRWTLPNGLILQQVRVPLGVIGLIYESRPGVTIEATSLAVKSGNAILLRGSREALHTNQALVDLWQTALRKTDLSPDLVQLVADPDRSVARALMHLKGLDLLIPRGGAALIQSVVQEATVPVVETGVGNCHLYVDAEADQEMALHILLDGKMGNPAVCNALETLLVHRNIHETFLPRAYDLLSSYHVVWHGDETVLRLIPDAVPATEEDWAEEYLGLHLAVKVVDSAEEALAHIARYGSGHSESIVTNDYRRGQEFLSRVDAACVYWNASTRFSDGFQFGFGAEVGISTQKLHARGPMGLDALTTIKTVAYGSGQTRDF